MCSCAIAGIQSLTYPLVPRSLQVLDAIDAFVARLIGTSDPGALRSMSSDFSINELSKVLLWLLVVGYSLRTAEMQMDMQSQ